MVMFSLCSMVIGTIILFIDSYGSFNISNPEEGNFSCKNINEKTCNSYHGDIDAMIMMCKEFSEKTYSIIYGDWISGMKVFTRNSKKISCKKIIPCDFLCTTHPKIEFMSCTPYGTNSKAVDVGLYFSYVGMITIIITSTSFY